MSIGATFILTSRVVVSSRQILPFVVLPFFIVVAVGVVGGGGPLGTVLVVIIKGGFIVPILPSLVSGRVGCCSMMPAPPLILRLVFVEIILVATSLPHIFDIYLRLFILSFGA